MSYNLWSELSNDLSSLLENDNESNDYNVIIKVGDEKFYAHSCILRSRSKYFCEALSKKWANREDDKIVLSKPNMKPEVFNAILKYIYSGSFNFDEFNPQIILEILVASDEFIFESLIDTIQTYMIEKQSEWLQLNIIHPLNVICRHDHITRLRDYVIKLVCMKPHLLFESKDFPQLEEFALIYVIKQDELKLNEIEIWENVINWGAACNDPQLNQDRTKWTDDDLLALKNALRNCIPLIRFYHMTSDQYNKCVKTPFQVILPEELEKNLTEYHINNAKPEAQILPSRILFGSNIINSEDANRIASWIDWREKLCYTLKENPFEFKLLLRGSRDGFNVGTFHNLCDNKGATIVVIKVQGSEEVVGGYNPINWEKVHVSNMERPRMTFNSFLFSFTNHNSPKLSRVLAFSKGICWNNNKAPYFGSDLCTNDNKFWTSKQKSYQDIIIQESFFAEDYEVFQVLMKNDQFRIKQMIYKINLINVIIFGNSFLSCIFDWLILSKTLSFRVFTFTFFGQLILLLVLNFYQCHQQEYLLGKMIYVYAMLKVTPFILFGSIISLLAITTMWEIMVAVVKAIFSHFFIHLLILIVLLYLYLCLFENYYDLRSITR